MQEILRYNSTHFRETQVPFNIVKTHRTSPTLDYKNRFAPLEQVDLQKADTHIRNTHDQNQTQSKPANNECTALCESHCMVDKDKDPVADTAGINTFIDYIAPNNYQRMDENALHPRNPSGPPLLRGDRAARITQQRRAHRPTLNNTAAEHATESTINEGTTVPPGCHNDNRSKCGALTTLPTICKRMTCKICKATCKCKVPSAGNRTGGTPDTEANINIMDDTTTFKQLNRIKQYNNNSQKNIMYWMNFTGKAKPTSIPSMKTTTPT